MSVVVVQNSSKLVACRGKATRILNRLKFSQQLAVLKWAGHGRNITRSDLVACRTELVVMLWDAVHSRRLVKHGELPTRYLRVTTILKETSHEFLRHLTSLLRHSYEYPRLSCRTRRTLQLIATRGTSGELWFAPTRSFNSRVCDSF